MEYPPLTHGSQAPQPNGDYRESCPLESTLKTFLNLSTKAFSASNPCCCRNSLLGKNQSKNCHNPWRGLFFKPNWKFATTTIGLMGPNKNQLSFVCRYLHLKGRSRCFDIFSCRLVLGKVVAVSNMYPHDRNHAHVYCETWGELLQSCAWFGWSDWWPIFFYIIYTIYLSSIALLLGNRKHVQEKVKLETRSPSENPSSLAIHVSAVNL